MAAASWKKVIVSGSIAELANLSVDNNVNVSGSLNVGANQQINLSSAKLSGSFSGSFEGSLKSVLLNANKSNIVSYDVATGTFSYQGTGSFSATTASYITSSGVDGPFGSNSILSASHAVSASLAQRAISSSFASTASIATSSSYALSSSNALTASIATSSSYALSSSFALTASIATSSSFALSSSFATTASFATSASRAVTSSFAITASFALNVPTASVTSSFALTASYLNPLTQSVFLSGSLTISGSLSVYGQSGSSVQFTQTDPTTGSLFAVNNSNNQAIFAVYANNVTSISGSTQITGSLIASGGVTGSLLGTASFATQALSSSFASTASFATNFTASNILVNGTITAQTLVVQTVTSSIVFSSGSNRFGNSLTNTQQFTGSVTITGSLSVNGQSVILANQTSSMSVLSASFAVSASQAALAQTASYVQNAQTASYVLNAVSSSFATTASYATQALSSSQAINADTASYVNTLNQAVVISGSLAVRTATGNSFALNADTLTFTGSLSTSGSVSFALASQSLSYLVGYNPATGNLAYNGTGSVVSATASYAISASYAINADTASYVDAANVRGLNLNQITSGSATASISPNNGLTVNTDTRITGSLNVSGSLYVTGGAVYVNEIYPYDPASQNRLFVTTPQGSAFSAPGDTLIYNSINDIKIEAVGGNVKLQANTLVAGTIQTTGSLVIGAAGATGSFTGSFQGDGSKLTGVSASILLSALSQSTGITPFNFDGRTSAAVEVSGASTLNSSSVVLWNGNAFANSSITDTTEVLINNPGGLHVFQGGLDVTGSSTFHNNVAILGNLTVSGTASFQNSSNLAIADQFILLNSGSTTFQDSGFVINTGNTGNSGSAFFLETAGTTDGTTSRNGRFAVAGNVQPDATTVTAQEYAVTTQINTGAPSAVPQFGGQNLGQGNMFISTDTNDIWIYA